jgi:hypothetical protein
MTPEFEARLKKAVEDGLLPNAVVLARDKSGPSCDPHPVPWHHS